jgi:hypothetical protein
MEEINQYPINARSKKTMLEQGIPVDSGMPYCLQLAAEMSERKPISPEVDEDLCRLLGMEPSEQVEMFRRMGPSGNWVLSQEEQAENLATDGVTSALTAELAHWSGMEELFRTAE